MEEAARTLTLSDGTECTLTVVSRYRNMKDMALGWKETAAGESGDVVVVRTALFEFTITAVDVDVAAGAGAGGPAPPAVRRRDAFAVTIATPKGYRCEAVDTARNTVRFVQRRRTAQQEETEKEAEEAGARTDAEWLTEVSYEAGAAPQQAAFALRLTEDTKAHSLDVAEISSMRRNVSAAFVKL